MKALTIVLFFGLFWSASCAQSNNFEFSYEREVSCGLLHNIEYPLINIKNDSLYYTYRQKTSQYSIERYDDIKYIDTVWVYDTIRKYVKFRQTSKDSIVNAMNQIKDTFIVSLIISPGDFDDQTLMVKNGHRKRKEIHLVNTFDSNAVPIVTIINSYLPADYKIDIPYSQWNDDIEQQKRLDSLLDKSRNR